MSSLYDYDILNNDVFYRSEHILSYLERHPNLSPLDQEAISNTILDALIYTKSIDPTKESLDLPNMSIVSDIKHHSYNPIPNITSIPLYIKAKMRQPMITISAGVPISLFYAKPAGHVTYCIYDMNTALSSLFPHFRFIECNYDSPTREGAKVTRRPFLEIPLNGEPYLVDALTKRLFKTSWFTKQYNMEITSVIDSSSFNHEQQSIYKEQTSPYNSYAEYLALALPLLEQMKNHPKQEETIYELEKSKECHPTAFAKYEILREEMSSFNLLFNAHHKKSNKINIGG